MRRLFFPASALALTTLVLGFTSPARAQITMEGVARSVSAFTALAIECAPLMPIDLDKARDYEQAFLAAGKKTYGEKRFLAALVRENKRRIREVKTTGRPQWCAYQKGYMTSLGMGDLFAQTKAGEALAQVQTALSYLIAAQACQFKLAGRPMQDTLGPLGLDTADFMPRGRYSEVMEVKTIKAIEDFKRGELACPTIEKTLRDTLPGLLE